MVGQSLPKQQPPPAVKNSVAIVRHGMNMVWGVDLERHLLVANGWFRWLIS